MRPVLLASALTLAALPGWAGDVTVFAAASLKNALDEVAAEFAQRTGNTTAISYAGSNALARQIIEGAPADIFISASTDWMDEVEKAGLTRQRGDLLGNTLVLIAHGTDAEAVPISSDTDLAGMLDGGKLAMALVEAVPAGQYGKAALENLGLWDGVQADVAQSDNVRAALALVAAGEAPLGIVYATDAAAEDNVTVVGTFPPDSHPAITYSAALLTGADGAGRAFYDALSGDPARAIFENHGFVVTD
ncbi:molybdate ABC transporter substrate-binding protein [Paracoccus sediminis]|uniref:Molybdate ABC transporter substrate-binding protein n=1 Tax=Paracoccus sediminis TaxID=1214787 RepID=A0A238WVK7_9RHOB|nr:molybdate ABC transporter substrate-binding protein [Paracoccus sediminis]TBN50009.1 molybdate ABC transporter substrate-binding protein [Paracoccus sediminis]SNR50224.1 molybdate transport system substrate-binding protein [Paracoccus sediminis]